MEPNAEPRVGRKSLLGNCAFCLFWSRQLTQSWFYIKSLYPIDLESCLMPYQSVFCEEVFLNEPKIDLCRNLCRVQEDGENVPQRWKYLCSFSASSVEGLDYSSSSSDAHTREREKERDIKVALLPWKRLCVGGRKLTIGSYIRGK